jgi:hypothetical protein
MSIFKFVIAKESKLNKMGSGQQFPELLKYKGRIFKDVINYVIKNWQFVKIIIPSGYVACEGVGALYFGL